MKGNKPDLIKGKAKREIEAAKTVKELNQVFQNYLGKKGIISRLLKELKNLTKEERVRMGKKINELKSFLRAKLEEKEKFLEKEKARQKEAAFDITAPGRKMALGHLHPLTQIRRKVEEIFQSMGFSIAQGPEIEDEWHNFDALNIPPEHPARDAWDTLYLKEQKLLLRTHTSPVQIRYMEKHQPPLRIIAPGRVFRHEATDARHEFQLFQIEGLMVEKAISVANLKAVLSEFFRRFFTKDIRFRLDPDFFPFTEPSFNVSVTCVICRGRGCSLCKKSGWLEIAGAGMVHPNVFKNCGLNPKEWQGWAFGFGLDRLAMMKYRIDDVRLFRSADLRFLSQF